MAFGIPLRPGRLLPILQLAERHGERCGGPVLLSGLILGIGVVELSCGALGQTSRFSLELLTLLVLQLAGPMLVALLSTALLLPSWLEPGEWRQGSLAAALTGALLMVLFVLAALTGGVLASPRADLLGEFQELLSGLLASDLLRSIVRAALFLAILCGWCQWRGMPRLRRGVAPALVSSNLLLEALTLLMGLKLLWIVVLDPVRLGVAPP
ncbi:MAG: hypothetical protein VKM98_07700 [Cyanobacteriota bacterium]|nr:hypothetical protein [Cyanobacteriota bacterium]